MESAVETTAAAATDVAASVAGAVAGAASAVEETLTGSDDSADAGAANADAATESE